ncbi:hypothetical protein VP01_119g6 [Puccinia sorghi]|uniref:Uncharacterized protein n=1 Tax=Puccinia sorghi TaxID=27349 RepID=A0A0L6VS31_9BASI|nr:hypothetical protein VP01_119g6 [Puccinia sorghi]
MMILETELVCSLILTNTKPTRKEKQVSHHIKTKWLIPFFFSISFFEKTYIYCQKYFCSISRGSIGVRSCLVIIGACGSHLTSRQTKILMNNVFNTPIIHLFNSSFHHSSLTLTHHSIVQCFPHKITFYKNCFISKRLLISGILGVSLVPRKGVDSLKCYWGSVRCPGKVLRVLNYWGSVRCPGKVLNKDIKSIKFLNLIKSFLSKFMSHSSLMLILKSSEKKLRYRFFKILSTICPEIARKCMNRAQLEKRTITKRTRRKVSSIPLSLTQERKKLILHQTEDKDKIKQTIILDEIYPDNRLENLQDVIDFQLIEKLIRDEWHILQFGESAKWKLVRLISEDAITLVRSFYFWLVSSKQTLAVDTRVESCGSSSREAWTCHSKAGGENSKNWPGTARYSKECPGRSGQFIEIGWSGLVLQSTVFKFKEEWFVISRKWVTIQTKGLALKACVKIQRNGVQLPGRVACHCKAVCSKWKKWHGIAGPQIGLELQGLVWKLKNMAWSCKEVHGNLMPWPGTKSPRNWLKLQHSVWKSEEMACNFQVICGNSKGLALQGSEFQFKGMACHFKELRGNFKGMPGPSKQCVEVRGNSKKCPETARKGVVIQRVGQELKSKECQLKRVAWNCKAVHEIQTQCLKSIIENKPVEYSISHSLINFSLIQSCAFLSLTGKISFILNNNLYFIILFFQLSYHLNAIPSTFYALPCIPGNSFGLTRTDFYYHAIESNYHAFPCSLHFIFRPFLLIKMHCYGVAFHSYELACTVLHSWPFLSISTHSLEVTGHSFDFSCTSKPFLLIATHCLVVTHHPIELPHAAFKCQVIHLDCYTFPFSARNFLPIFTPSLAVSGHSFEFPSTLLQSPSIPFNARPFLWVATHTLQASPIFLTSIDCQNIPFKSHTLPCSSRPFLLISIHCFAVPAIPFCFDTLPCKARPFLLIDMPHLEVQGHSSELTHTFLYSKPPPFLEVLVHSFELSCTLLQHQVSLVRISVGEVKVERGAGVGIMSRLKNTTRYPPCKIQRGPVEKNRKGEETGKDRNKTGTWNRYGNWDRSGYRGLDRYREQGQELEDRNRNRNILKQKRPVNSPERCNHVTRGLSQARTSETLARLYLSQDYQAIPGPSSPHNFIPQLHTNYHRNQPNPVTPVIKQQETQLCSFLLF